MMRPKLIILDEPTEGIMPKLVSQIRREIHRINQTGVSVLLVEQNVETALKLCPRVFLMEKGTIVYSGASQELKSQPEIVHRYLGLTKSI
jgi:branched-chain amino acid transport system ATP-binding protein